MDKRLYAAIISAVVVIFAIAAAIFLASPQEPRFAINSGLCAQSGGRWNDCGSPCTGMSQGTICIQSCQQQCEWYSGAAYGVRVNSTFSASPSFRCLTQDNGILMCWLPVKV